MVRSVPTRRFSWRARLLLLGISSMVALLLAEGVLRIVRGFDLFTFRLRERRAVEPAIREESEGGRLFEFLKPDAARTDLETAWIFNAPPARPRKVTPAELEDRSRRYLDSSINYILNESLVRRTLETRSGTLFGQLKACPAEFVFTSPGPKGEDRPAYRYFPDVTLPSGLTTNRFGFRGPELTLAKPPQTLRIACVGASTTVDLHNLAHSYPELLQHWLNLWAAKNAIGLRFEVINAGREGFGPEDIAAIVRHEIEPFRPDYVVFYEGVNRFEPGRVLQYPDGPPPPEPPADLVPAFETPGEGGWWDGLARHSAIAAAFRTVARRAPSLAEPKKPRQSILLPPGVTEETPDPVKSRATLNLDLVLGSLDTLRADLDAHDVRLVLGTFCFLAEAGLELDPLRHEGIFTYLNRIDWPASYASIRRLMDFQNRVFRAWAASSSVPLLDVDARMPRLPDLYVDGVHQNAIGVGLKAWIIFSGLTTLIRADLDQGRVPRSSGPDPAPHPSLTPWTRFPIPR